MDEFKKWLEEQIRYWEGQKDNSVAVYLQNLGMLNGLQTVLNKVLEMEKAPAPEV